MSYRGLRRENEPSFLVYVHLYILLVRLLMILTYVSDSEMRRNHGEYTVPVVAAAHEDPELVSLLNCESLPLSRWVKCVDKHDSTSYARPYSDDEHGDSKEQEGW